MDSEYAQFTTFVNFPACSIVHELDYDDQCRYVSVTPECINRRFYVNYIQMLYCHLKPRSYFTQVLGAIALLSLCLVMFVILATTAERIFCPALKVMSHILGLNEHLAGITLLAFGNGSPDLFTSLASINDDTRMLFSDLFGAAVYVITIVGGIICLVTPFKLMPQHILRDVCFFMFGAVYIEYIIVSDNCVTTAESIGILVIYVAFLSTNFVDQILLKRLIMKLKRRQANRKYYSEQNARKLEQLRAEAGVELHARGSRAFLDKAETRTVIYNPQLPANNNLFKQFIDTLNPIDVQQWRTGRWFQRAWTVVKTPCFIFLTLFMPIVDYELKAHGWSKLLNSLQVMGCPTLMVFAIFPHVFWFGVPACAYMFFISVPFSVAVFFTTRTDLPPAYHCVFALLSVMGSIIVIYTCASETVQIFYVLGIVTNVSNAFLGCTLLAWGNSIADLVANTAMARSGLQNMGFAACYGGPLFNCFLAMGSTFLYKCLKSEKGQVVISQGAFGENGFVFLIIALMGTLTWATSTNFQGRRSVGVFSIIIYALYFTYTLLGELELIQTGNNFDWNRSFSEPDLAAPIKSLNRFLIRNPHEYISVDDLKYFRRRKKPPDAHTKSQLCLSAQNETVLPNAKDNSQHNRTTNNKALQSEYRASFQHLDLSLCERAILLRRATSLRLVGLMQHKSEHQEQYHWYTPQDWEFCRTYPVRNPECFRVDYSDVEGQRRRRSSSTNNNNNEENNNHNENNMQPEYRSSFITFPMVDRTAKILPREMFRIDGDDEKGASVAHQLADRSPAEVAAINKLAEDKFKRDVAAQEQQHKCHLQQRAAGAEPKRHTTPSEYKRQYVQFPIEKAHSIPQISHIKMQGEFRGVPEYQDSFKMYTNYSKSAPIKKVDNLRVSGAEVEDGTVSGPEMPEYREKFCKQKIVAPISTVSATTTAVAAPETTASPPPLKTMPKTELLKTDDHLRPQGEFSKDVPEYYESFRDPQVRQMPERGKCREPYLRLKGKIEFNPEYRNTYLDFPRSRPIVRKPASSLRLPVSNTTTASTATAATNNTTNTAEQQAPTTPKRTPRRKYKSSSPQRFTQQPTQSTTTSDVTVTPEYRRANYNYQLRERTPTRKITESEPHPVVPGRRKPSTSSTLEEQQSGKSLRHKRHSSRVRHASVMEPERMDAAYQAVTGSIARKPPKFGRRAAVLQNAANCRQNSSIIEGNPKYTQTPMGGRDPRYDRENRESFVVLNEPQPRSNWMKKSWYES